MYSGSVIDLPQSDCDIFIIILLLCYQGRTCGFLERFILPTKTHILFHRVSF